MNNTELPKMVYGTGKQYSGRVTKHIARCTQCTPGSWFPNHFHNRNEARRFGRRHMQESHDMVPAEVVQARHRQAEEAMQSMTDTNQPSDSPVANPGPEDPSEAPEAVSGAHSGQSGSLVSKLRDVERRILNRKGIDELRKMSRGRFSGGYSMKKADLIEALIDCNV